MEHILIKIKDKNKTDLLIEVLSKFDFLEIETNIDKGSIHKKKVPKKAFTTEQQKFIDGLKQAFNEVVLHQQGKLKLKTFDDFIKEL